MKTTILMLIALVLAATAGSASAGGRYDIGGPIACGSDTAGRCTIANDGVDLYTFQWAASGALQVVDYDAATYVVKGVYNGLNPGNPRNVDVSNVLLTDALGRGVVLSLNLTAYRKLITSGHNRFENATRIDSGTLVPPSVARRDVKAKQLFVTCRDAVGGTAQRACEATYATFVAANYSPARR